MTKSFPATDTSSTDTESLAVSEDISDVSYSLDLTPKKNTNLSPLENLIGCFFRPGSPYNNNQSMPWTIPEDESSVDVTESSKENVKVNIEKNGDGIVKSLFNNETKNNKKEKKVSNETGVVVKSRSVVFENGSSNEDVVTERHLNVVGKNESKILVANRSIEINNDDDTKNDNEQIKFSWLDAVVAIIMVFILSGAFFLPSVIWNIPTILLLKVHLKHREQLKM